MEPNKSVWAPDIVHGYVIGKIVDILENQVSVQVVSVPSQHQPTHQASHEQPIIECNYSSVYPCEVDKDDQDRDDNCSLIHLNEATLLENLRIRFHRDKIYTYVAHILIAVNPYFEIAGLHSPQAIEKYQGKSLGTMPPHVFAIDASSNTKPLLLARLAMPNDIAAAGDSLNGAKGQILATTADKAYRDMKALKQSQSIIISGESGAGKTESQKYVLRYLCLSGSQSGRLEKLILDANPLLEAFGNAKTTRNNNSSRFGKFIEIHYNNKFTVSGGLFFHYLLEKSRICCQSPGERNYHIFYQLCCCLPDQLWQQLELGSPDKFHYLKGGCTQYFCSRQMDSGLNARRKSSNHVKFGAIQDQLIDDIECYKQTDRALTNFGVTDQQKLAIYSIVAAVLHLGNIAFEDDLEDNRGGCRVSASTEQSLKTAARLCGLDVDQLRQSLVSRIMSTTRGGHKGTVYMVQLSVLQAQAARDALAKAIYSKLFDHIVTKIVNKSIPFTASSYYIGVLDVAGFEYFQHNSFEQFLINFCNEKLQQFFNQRILKEEQMIYEKEGLNLKKIDFIDNQDCLDLLETKGIGIFDLLDEESRLPKPSAQHFTQSVHQSNKNHFRLAMPRASKLKYHREIRDDEGFLIRHFAGAVCYETASFIDKNNDALHASLKNLMLEAQNQLLKDLFEPSGDSTAPHHTTSSNLASVNTASLMSQPSSNKLNFISVGTTFRSQLNDLMSKLRSTGSHFIRCIKPNSEMVAHKFEGGQILSQLRCSGMNSVLQLMQQGYPSRSSFNDLYASYKRYLPADLARLDSHLFCRALFKAIGLNDNDFRFGSSKVFFRPGKFAEFDQIIRSDSDHVAELVKRVSYWLVCSRWRKAQYCTLSVIKLKNKILYRREVIVKIQKNWRMAIMLDRFKFRLNTIVKGKKILASLMELEAITKQLKMDDERSRVDGEIKLLRKELDQLIARVRNEIQSIHLAHTTGTQENSKRSKETMGQQLSSLSNQRDKLIMSINDRIAKQDELLKLQKKMADEARLRQEEELQRRRDDEMKQQRAELELRRQMEVSRLQQQSGGANNLVSMATGKSSGRANQDNLYELCRQQQQAIQDDQEQRDYEIALRLAQESDATAALNQVAQSAAISPLGLSSANKGNSGAASNGTASSGLGTQTIGNNKYDLSKWKYSDLRDTINTSCDLELLEACKREFHRRLKVYHAWKSKHSRTNADFEERAPSSVMQDGFNSADMDRSLELLRNSGNNEQRFFRIPFVKPSATTGQRGWWFAHFDGQWIARQLELHPDRQPILLVAGRDDMSMCELSLKETRLTSKRGAEILPQEFEEEWAKYGGKPYVARGA